MSRGPWQVMRVLRMLIACVVLGLFAAPEARTPGPEAAVVLVARARAAQALEVRPSSPRPSREEARAVASVRPPSAKSPPRTAPADGPESTGRALVVVRYLYLNHRALLC